MPNLTPEQQADLQAFCDKYQGHLAGTFTPVNPDTEAFDLTVTATTNQPAPEGSTPSPAPTDQPVA